MQNKNLNPIIDLRSQYYIENLEKNGYKIRKRNFKLDFNFIKKVIVIAGFILFFLTIYLNYFVKKSEARKDFTLQEKIRIERLKSCQKYAKIEKIYGQDAVVRCATFATIVFAFESDFGKSWLCQNQKNCYGIKGNGIEYPAGFINFKNFDEANNFFAKKYFQFHYKKKVEDFVYSWSMTDRKSYIYFFNKNYQKIYSEIENVKAKHDMK
ncbi:hypothetical protein D8B46_08715 [Candidatus Gracilibacteria bacterium]|nr:MAG: hypothetical protein D8B46_08715 [Candidatus Gracilibacteria bacterium]